MADSTSRIRVRTWVIGTLLGVVVLAVLFAFLDAKRSLELRALEEAAPRRPISHIIVSHSHADHEGGVRFWAESETEIITHREFPEEQRYLKELEPYRFTRGGVCFEVLATPGAEGADNLVLWLPGEKILFSGDFFGPLFPQFPNIFTMRGEKVRKPIEYIRSLDQLIALEPEMIVPSHKDPIEGRERIRAAMVRIRDAVQYVHDATVAGMNAGKTVHELMADIELPPELELSQVHGRVSWAVKSIWEYYATWFHFDTTTELYPVPPSAVYDDLVELAGLEALVTRARAQIAEGRPVHPLHLLDIALGSDGRSRSALEAA